MQFALVDVDVLSYTELILCIRRVCLFIFKKHVTIQNDNIV